MPLAELWDDSGPLEATQLGELGEDDVRAQLRLGAHGALASIGEPLRWMRGTEFFDWWKSEARPRLVAPGHVRHYDVPWPDQPRRGREDAQADGFRLEDFPGERCWSASEWRLIDGSTVVLFEEHH